MSPHSVRARAGFCRRSCSLSAGRGPPLYATCVMLVPASDNGTVKRVVVNGQEAKALRDNFAEWEVTLKGTPAEVKAHAEDTAGNVEKRAHVVTLNQR